MSSFPCPKCGHDKTKCVDSRKATIDGLEPSTRRRRKCLNPDCGHRFSTQEMLWTGEWSNTV